MSWDIFKKKILITVKTYPTLSSKYDELVCTAWVTEEWEWIRIYPMPFRKFEDYKQYGKYNWVEIELIKNTSDPRPESYRPFHTPAELQIIWEITTWADRKWTERKQIVLKNVYTDLAQLIKSNKDDTWTSLAIFKPTEILDFTFEECERKWDPKKIKIIEKKSKQTNMFEETKPFKLMPKLPYKFKYVLKDINWVESKMMLEDWEVWQLFWNCLKDHWTEKLACQKVREKYFDDFAKTKDLHFFLWTSRQFDGWSNNPFMIIWTFHPPKDERLSLF